MKYIVPLVLAALVVAAGVWFINLREPRVNTAAKPGELTWKAKVGRRAFSPVVSGNTVCCFGYSVWEVQTLWGFVPGELFASHPGQLRAFDTDTGKSFWVRRPAWGPPQALNGQLFSFDYEQRRMLALDAVAGTEESTFDLPAGNCGVFDAGEPVMCIWGAQGIRLVDVGTGAEKWSIEGQELSASIDGGPAVADGSLYYSSRDGKLHSLDIATGGELWTYDNQGRIFNIKAGDGIVCFAYGTGVMRAVDAKSGRKKWEFGRRWFQGGIVNSSRVYLRDGNDFCCVRAEDGYELWRFSPSPGGFVGDFTVSGGAFYCSANNALYSLDAVTGVRRWTFQTDGVILGRPGASMDTAYVATDKGWLYAVAAEPEEQTK